MSNDSDIPVICLMGPTASGKTDLAIELCGELNGQIISVDSALVYRQMDIGTAKPTAEELARAPHHLIDICDPTETYSAAQFASDAKAIIERLLRQGKTPILAGGTMLYFKALLEGLAQLPATDKAIRQKVAEVLDQRGSEALHRWLAEFDEESAERLHPNDPQRLSRAIEVYLMSGKTLSQFHREQRLQPLQYANHCFAIAPAQRSDLHQRIEQRFDKMLADGFVEEVRALYQRGDLSVDMPSIRCVGYRQIWSYLSGESTLEEARYRGIVATRQLAKRQFTWLRSWPNLTWLRSGDKNNLANVLKIIGATSI
ncbi:MAG: tRNA (adenosine(37)-N6)-dimethylallyltransferase MiaA [Kangiellaceae bacterium]|jgi:tRNA dimethylallyltransferase|nr:tRNA (adenosine(37)-N6)-dimethylallyltransferase MiaA [Kangiellaceae bacterium]